ncbi:MAG: hypothetical protein J5I91_00300 [Bacteroidetes bacterium]|nr:hypothetical protein [Bacteroidota bacterium]
MTNEQLTRKTPYNSTYPKVAVQWLNQALCYYPNFCLVDSEVLLNRNLRVAATRCTKLQQPATDKGLRMFSGV